MMQVNYFYRFWHLNQFIWSNRSSRD